MQQLKRGQYFGNTHHEVHLDGFTVTDTEYTHDYVDWHCHENPYFTFLLQGAIVEENKKEAYCLSQGSLIFHNWQDVHRNIKPPIFTRGAHLEIQSSWAETYGLNLYQVEGSIPVHNPYIKNLLYHVLLESRISDAYRQTSVALLVMDILAQLKKDLSRETAKRPSWHKKLEALIHEEYDRPLTLGYVSGELDIHPVHLSRTFHKYYGTTFGNYCREIRLNRAVASILNDPHSLSDIAYRHHFSDQSHMIASFRKKFNLTPKQFEQVMG
ncbi:MAG: AraC family transcriptional regulator [Bacteroidota bacterium]